ncbi:SAM-dependent methyltransferase [uncultured Dechloromonas sp.]|uniref:class I SAM-dependent methyltransferase n=1 Tax=uncultured Dechloromonas sp. TaxID=171719 RepID=UPI0025D2F604|nr:SAM-dependent methyltransferase [uncultured Dechloromonas sp.]
MNNLPAPAPEAIVHSQRLTQAIADDITAAGGWISFARFMEQVLYRPGLGYYTAGARKFGAAGDFVTAPEMSALFGRAVARQVMQVLARSAPCVLEVGAGSGRLAADLLLELERLGGLPERYFILDLSADLRERQQQTIAAAAPHLLSRVSWLDRLPARFSGVVLANELLDAMPAHVVAWREDGIFDRGVALDADGGFTWQERPATGALLAAARQIGEQCQLPPGFESEISLAVSSWAAEWGHRLDRGALLLIDYGFPRREFYHQQRGRGTLMCHYRHHAHPDPFYLPGLQDVTVHVDFTAVIAGAHGAGLDLLGYASQGQFLLNCGILDLLADLPNGTPEYIRAAGAVNTLLMPHEMGELFKVIAIGRGIDDALLGFASGDQGWRL